MATILLLSTLTIAVQNSFSSEQVQSMQLGINTGPQPATDNFQLSEGYTIEPTLWNLSLPTSVAFDENGTMYLAESGFAYGGLSPQPRILKVANNGTISILLDRMLNGPVNDIEYYQGKLYVSHRGVISTIDPVKGGLPKDIIVGLPSNGDHHNNQIAFGPDGRLYFGQGTATNSGVVGMDNFRFGWPQQDPWFHDMPGSNITLTANANSMTPNPLTPEPNDTAVTGAFVPFGNRTEEGQLVMGETKCNGCIISANPDGTDLRVEAWGLRNPFGAAFSQNGTLLVTMNGADERGSRPVANDTDKIYNIDVSEEAKFYGWPDFFGNAEPATLERFQSPRANVTIGNATAGLQFIMQDHPEEIVKPLAQVQVAAALTQVDFSNSSEFGHEGMAFAAEFGSMIPATHSPKEIEVPRNETIGHKVIMVDPQTGNHTEFLSLEHHSDLFRPVGVEFNDQEGALYVVSLGKMEVRMTLPDGTPLPHPVPWAYENTGTVWKIAKSGNNNSTDVAAALPS